MRNKLSKAIFILCFSYSFWMGPGEVNAQNLVPNSSFEDTVGTFPFGPGYIYYSPPWYNAYGSVDLYNACDVTNNYGVPISWGGGGVAHTGNAYAGILSYISIIPNVKEFVEVPLTDTLKAGKKYYVSFFVSLADSDQYALSDIGAYFSANGIGNNLYQIITYIPQIKNPIGNFLTNKAGWMEISDTITAIGGEKFMAIGSFTNDSISPDTLFVGGTTTLNWKVAYYYLDDVSVTEIPTGIHDAPPMVIGITIQNFSISPNPTSGKFTIYNSQFTIYDLAVYNVLGEKVFYERQESIHENQDSRFKNQDVDISAEPAGIYFVRTKTNQGVFFNKILKE